MKAPNRSICIVILLAFLATAAHAQKTKYVILVTIDGLRPDFYLDPSWNAPNMRSLMQKGVYAESVRGIFPTVTYPSHTTIITGAFPARHGIYYNAPFEPEGATGKWNWAYSLIKAPTLWYAAHKAGLTTASVLWPVTVGADCIDYNVPEIWNTDSTHDRVQPMKDHTTPAGLWEEIEQNATGKLRHNDLNEDYVLFDENIARMASYLIVAHKPNFLTVHFACVDNFEHDEGRDGEGVRKAVAGADHCIGKLLEAIDMAGIKDSTAIIVTGDHGFANIYTALMPNVWLARNGLIERIGTKTEWKAKFQSTGGSAFLYLKDSSDKNTLIQVAKILEELPAATKKLFRVVEKSELVSLGADPNAALAISPVEGVALGGGASGSDLRAWPQKGAHGFFPTYPDLYTGFIGYGQGLGKGIVIKQLNMEDIAPVVAKLLGIPFNAPDGILQPGILTAP